MRRIWPFKRTKIISLTSAWGVGGKTEVSFSVTFPVGPLFGELGPDPGELLLTEDSEKYCEVQISSWKTSKGELYYNLNNIQHWTLFLPPNWMTNAISLNKKKRENFGNISPKFVVLSLFSFPSFNIVTSSIIFRQNMLTKVIFLPYTSHQREPESLWNSGYFQFPFTCVSNSMYASIKSALLISICHYP